MAETVRRPSGFFRSRNRVPSSGMTQKRAWSDSRSRSQARHPTCPISRCGLGKPASHAVRDGPSPPGVDSSNPRTLHAR
eukprot:3247855-Prymnesium_polylepis.2